MRNLPTLIDGDDVNVSPEANTGVLFVLVLFVLF